MFALAQERPTVRKERAKFKRYDGRVTLAHEEGSAEGNYVSSFFSSLRMNIPACGGVSG